MANFAILRTKKLSNKGNIGGSLRHTLREIETVNADPQETPNNSILIGPATTSEIIEAIDRRLAIKTHCAKEPVLAIEYLFTYSPEATVDAPSYFSDCLSWLKTKHGEENVVSAVAHYDETTPHLVAYVVPLDFRPGKERKRNVADGRNLDGTRRRKDIVTTVGAEVWLSAAVFLGSKTKLTAMQTAFAEEVGKKHQLVRGIEGSKATHTTLKKFYAMLCGQAPELLEKQLAQFARAANLSRQRAKAQADQALKQLQVAERRVQMLREAHGDEVEQMRADQALVVAQLRSEITGLRRQIQAWAEWVVDALTKVWNALTAGGVPVAREAIAEALGEIRADPELTQPEHRIEVRPLADGSWRGSVFDHADIEVWSEVCDDEAESRYLAEDWIAREQQMLAPAM